MESNTVIRHWIKNKFDLGPAFWKYLMLLLNVGFVISSVLLILSGVSTYLMFKTMYNEMGDAFRMLSIFWIVVAVTTAVVGTFGIFATLKENAILTNLYAIAMMFACLGAISAGIADFTLLSRSRFIVTDLLLSMITGYGYDYYGYGHDYRPKMDWIQSKFECCGIDAPSDWQQNKERWLPYELRTDNSSTIGDEVMPASCCLQNSNYVNLTCDKYHITGCFEPIYQILSETVMTIGYFGVIFSMLQMLAVIGGFVYAHIIRDRSGPRYMRVSNNVGEMHVNMNNDVTMPI